MKTQIKNNQLLISFLASIALCSLSSSVYAAKGGFFRLPSVNLKSSLATLAEKTTDTLATAANAARTTIEAVIGEGDTVEKDVQTGEKAAPTESKTVQTGKMVSDAASYTDPNSLERMDLEGQILLSRLTPLLNLMMPQAKKIIELEKVLVDKKVDPENLLRLGYPLVMNRTYVYTLRKLINDLEQVQPDILQNLLLLMIVNQIILDADHLVLCSESETELKNTGYADVGTLIKDIKNIATDMKGYELKSLLDREKLNAIQTVLEKSNELVKLLSKAILNLTSSIKNQVKNILDKCSTGKSDSYINELIQYGNVAEKLETTMISGAIGDKDCFTLLSLIFEALNINKRVEEQVSFIEKISAVKTKTEEKATETDDDPDFVDVYKLQTTATTEHLCFLPYP